MASLDDFDTPYIPWIKIDDGSSTEVQFLTEVEGFDYFCEHASPSNWMKSAVCTYDTGFCYACEQQARDWNQRIRVYIPVLHQGKLSVLSQGMGANSVIHSLLEYYVENGTILDTRFVISRNGSGKRTKYVATPIDKSEVLPYNGDISLSTIKKSIDYSTQAKYYK